MATVSSQKILVVGASSGIGYHVAQLLISQGYQVISASRHAPDLAVLKHIFLDVEHIGGNELAELEAIDGLVYCPGSINLKPFPRLSPDDFKHDWQINFMGAVQVIQMCLKALKAAPHPAVVLYSTVAVQTGLSFHASIASAKGAIEGLTRSLAAELAPKIRVNAIAPSLTDTPLAKSLLSTDEKKEASAKRHPLARIGTPDDIARATVFLLTNDSSWISGQVLAVDGGMSSIRMM